jgi:hypothetical protein
MKLLKRLFVLFVETAFPQIRQFYQLVTNNTYSLSVFQIKGGCATCWPLVHTENEKLYLLWHPTCSWPNHTWNQTLTLIEPCCEIRVCNFWPKFSTLASYMWSRETKRSMKNCFNLGFIFRISIFPRQSSSKCYLEILLSLNSSSCKPAFLKLEATDVSLKSVDGCLALLWEGVWSARVVAQRQSACLACTRLRVQSEALQ